MFDFFKKPQATRPNPMFWKPVSLALKDIFIPKPAGGDLEPLHEATISNGHVVSDNIIPNAPLNYKPPKSTPMKPTPIKPTQPAPIKPIIPNAIPSPVPIKPLPAIVAPPIKLQPFVPPQYNSPISVFSQKYNIDPKFLSAIIMTENRGWNNNARPTWEPSSTSIGLGQINDATLRDMERYLGKKIDRTNPVQSIEAVAAWLDKIRKYIGSNKPSDIAEAYNQGMYGFKEGRRNPAYSQTMEKYYNL